MLGQKVLATLERCDWVKTSELRPGRNWSFFYKLGGLSINCKVIILRVAMKMEVMNKRKKQLPLSREVEMLEMLQEQGGI